MTTPGGDLEHEPEVRDDNRWPAGFWILTTLLVAYVALCSVNRGTLWGADAWEHHRVLKTLAENPRETANPTLATSDRSARYSPYLLMWALFSRATGVDPFDALSAAAAVNTALLLLGAATLLKGLGEGRSAAAAIPVMVGLYGGIPAHSNSYALADLSWHEVNPSAFSFATALFVLSLFLYFERAGWRSVAIPLMVVLEAMALLDHVISGVFGLLGLGILALTAPPRERLRMLAGVGVVTIGAVALCLAWPWYSFLKAATVKLPAFFINPYINAEAIMRWCVPALVLSLFALTVPHTRAVRRLLPIGYASYLVGVAALVLPASSPGVGAVSRMPLPGLIGFHLALGIFAHHQRLFRPDSWPGRLHALLRRQGPEVALPVMETVFAVALLYFLLPQVWTVLSAPHLARPYIARLAGRAAKTEPIKPIFDRLMQPIGAKDVVISDENTMWVIPSSRGRVVSSLHGELFVPDQKTRKDDVEAFFSAETSDRDRERLIERYQVRWIVLNRRAMPPVVIDDLLEPEAVVREQDGFVLLNARQWLEARHRDTMPVPRRPRRQPEPASSGATTTP